MSSLAPAALVVGATRVPLPYGLFSTFTLRPEGADRWLTGVQWETITCATADGIGDPACGVNEVQSVTIGGAGLTSFTLTFGGQTTTAIPAASTGATVQARLEALSSIGVGNVVVAGGAGGPYTVTFTGRLAGTDVALLTATPTGGTGTVTPAQTTAGVPGGAATGLPKDLAKGTGGRGAVGTASAFTVYGHFNCSPVGYTPESAQGLATAHLMAREEARVEQALWTGDLGNTPNLQGATVVGVGGGMDAALGIGVLEDWGAANYGSLGVIHMLRSSAESLLGKQVLHSSGGKLTTGLGTPVAAGSGYPGTSPAGVAAAAGKAWAYITPALFGYRGEPFTSSNRPGDLFAKGTNNLYAVAERTYLLGYDPCGVAAVQINLP